MSVKAPRSRLAAIIAERIQQTSGSKELSQEIAAYLLAEGRTGELESILRDVMQYRADHGIVEITAVDARPLNDSVKSDIENLIKGIFPSSNKIIISEKIDTNVIGGVRLELANQQLDLSIRSKLNRFKQLTIAGGN